jgi:hypothetical protein
VATLQQKKVLRDLFARSHSVRRAGHPSRQAGPIRNANGTMSDSFEAFRGDESEDSRVTFLSIDQTTPSYNSQDHNPCDTLGEFYVKKFLRDRKENPRERLACCHGHASLVRPSACSV